MIALERAKLMDEQPQVEQDRLEPNQEQLLAALRAQGLEGCRVLDIGCGTGHLHHRLLDEGAASVVGVELSSDYLEQAKALARELGHEDRVTYLTGDFMELADQIEPADVTILDKVVHCYQEPESLVRQSTAHTRLLYALSFPRNSWRMRLIIGCLGPLARLFLPFRPRFSRPEAIRAWVREADFIRLSHDETKMWHTEVYVRRGEEHEL
jgi:2-polyprenyl-3-methyl-5-hydroxy-6-metoxy-1,4-benzoquinol methylase